MNNNDYDTEDSSNVNVECSRSQDIKQCMLNDVVLEREELQNQLSNAAVFIDSMVEKNKAVILQLQENYSILWNRYLCKSKDFDNSKNHNECLNAKIDGLIKNNESLKCLLHERDEKITYLEEKINKLDKCLNEEKQNTTCLKNQNQCHVKCLEEKSEELIKVTQKLNDKKDELCKEKEIIRKLKPKLDDCMNKLDKLKLKEFQQIKNIDILKSELEIEKTRYKECDQTVYIQKNQIQELTEELEKYNKKIEGLKQTMENEKNQFNCRIEHLRREKCNIEKERGDLERELKECMKEMEKLECQNEHMKIHMDELNCKLNTEINNSEEKEKLSTERFAKIQNDVKCLKADINVKSQLIVELEDKLLETKKLQKIESEKAHNLKIQFDNLKHKQNIMSSKKCSSSKCSIADDSNCNLMTSNVNEMMNNSNSDCKHLTASNKTCTDSSTDDFDVKNQVFEQLIAKCNSIVNYFGK